MDYSAREAMNPKSTVEGAQRKFRTLGPQLNDALMALKIYGYHGDPSEFIDAVFLPILTIAAAVENMERIEDVAQEIEEAKRKAMILASITPLLFLVPLAGHALGSVAAWRCSYDIGHCWRCSFRNLQSRLVDDPQKRASSNIQHNIGTFGFG